MHDMTRILAIALPLLLLPTVTWAQVPAEDSDVYEEEVIEPDEEDVAEAEEDTSAAKALDPQLRRHRGMARAGIVITLVGWGVHLGRIASLSVALRGDTDWNSATGPAVAAWLGLGIGEMVLHGAGVPTALASAIGIRKSLGMKGASGANVAGWVFYGITWVTEILSILPIGLGAIMTFVDIGVFAVSALLAMIDAGVASKLAKEELQQSSGALIVPFLGATGGGAVVGMRGTF